MLSLFYFLPLSMNYSLLYGRFFLLLHCSLKYFQGFFLFLVLSVFLRGLSFFSVFIIYITAAIGKGYSVLKIIA